MILDKAKAAQQELKYFKRLNDSVAEAVALAAKKKELLELHDKVKELASSRAMLQCGGVPLSPAPEISASNKSCTSILEEFKRIPKSNTLIEKKRWIKLTQVLEIFIKAELSVQKESWTQFFNKNLFNASPPDLIESTILMSLKDNSDAMIRYRVLYDKFVPFRNVVPTTRTDLENIKNWSIELSEIKFIQNDALPKAVREFFSAISSGRGANLDLLTKEVLDWLRTNNMLNNYSVKAK